jgi:SAM-dependent methyltransferase
MHSSQTSRVNLPQLKDLLLRHSQVGDATRLDAWLTHETLCRFQEWVPSPLAREGRLVDIGCCQPSIGYYFHLGWDDVVGVFKEEGDYARETQYTLGGRSARIVRADVEFEPVPVGDGWADAVLLMEIFEHFGTDPMHALWEANRILKPLGRLVLSTPNAASFNNIRRIMGGHAPYGGQEFNGFTTNRHNRIYDAHELEIILGQAGYRVDAITSRSYRTSSLSKCELGVYLVMSAADKIVEAFSAQKRERGEWLFVQAVKETAPRERYPKSLYFKFEEWHEWLALVQQGKIRKRYTHG